MMFRSLALLNADETWLRGRLGVRTCVCPLQNPGSAGTFLQRGEGMLRGRVTPSGKRNV